MLSKNMQNENYAYFCYEMYKIKIIILSVLITILSAACNQTQSKIEKVIKEIEYAERNKKEIPSQQLEKLQLQIEELQQDLNENQEIKELKKEISELKMKLQQAENQSNIYMAKANLPNY